jgi:hypothetical protein
MIRIFNNKSGNEILIDETSDFISFEPQDYNENDPHVKIIFHDFDWNRHTKKCDDCSALKAAFGSDTSDWMIQYLDKVARLDLRIFSKELDTNTNKSVLSYYFSGTELKLTIDNDTVEMVKPLIDAYRILENYEKCSVLTNKLKKL